MNCRYFSGLIAAVLAGVLASGPAGQVAAEDPRTPRGFERERVYSVPVQLGGFEVERVVVQAGDRRLGVSGEAGIVRESQDRIRLRGVPIVGQLFMDRLTRSDFDPAREVGAAYVEGRTLFVALDPAHQKLWFDTVVVVHDRFSYRFQGRLSGATVAPSGDPRPVGRAYARENALLVLIRPSVITDSIL